MKIINLYRNEKLSYTQTRDPKKTIHKFIKITFPKARSNMKSINADRENRQIQYKEKRPFPDIFVETKKSK